VNSFFPDLYDRTLARLVEARKRAGITQTQLAVKLGRTQSFVAKHEGREARPAIVANSASQNARHAPRQ
jgi:ribosome-binding protein aMBF1 (putative translation factor)